jgi:TonB family protein
LAIQLDEQGQTELAFTIKRDGTVADAVVKGSSGYPDLDSAAITCAETWTYRPATRGGMAVDLPWMALVVWKIPDTLAPPYDQMFDEAKVCVSANLPRGDLETAARRTVLLVVFDSGVIASADILASSGSQELDQRLADCWKNTRTELTSSIKSGKWVFPFDWAPFRSP